MELPFEFYKRPKVEQSIDKEDEYTFKKHIVIFLIAEHICETHQQSIAELEEHFGVAQDILLPETFKKHIVIFLIAEHMCETHQQSIADLEEHFGVAQDILLPEKSALIQQFLFDNYDDIFSHHFEYSIEDYMAVVYRSQPTSIWGCALNSLP